MKSKEQRAAKRAKRARQRHAAHEAQLLADRLRVGPEPSMRQRDESNAPTLTSRPFELVVDGIRQTPESWADVWADDD